MAVSGPTQQTSLYAEDVLAECAILFRENPHLFDNIHGLSQRLGRSEDEVKRAIAELVSRGAVRSISYANPPVYEWNQGEMHRWSRREDDVVQEPGSGWSEEFTVRESGDGEFDSSADYDERFRTLTRREREILRLMVQGSSNREMALALYISEHTVKNHVTAILRKMGCADRYQLVVTIFQHRR